MRLVEHGGGRITGGSIDFARRDGSRADLTRAHGATMRGIRGAEIAMIFQEPMTSLNPVFTVADQIGESIRLHQGMDRGAARAEALRMLDLVRIPEAAQVLERYPHQLSGGMRQRVMIAMALGAPPLAPDRRRADHGARCHRAGADPDARCACCRTRCTWR